MKIKKLLIATNNQGKLKDIKDILGNIGIEIFSLKDLKIFEDVEETGKTYEENSILKAKFFYKFGQMPVLADDSGIEVEILKGELGVKTRRWGAGEKADTKTWLDFFLKRMEKEENRNAKFICCLTFFDGKNLKTFQGECKGKLLKKAGGEIKDGIPLSSFFVPNGYKDVYVNLGKEIEDISHRGKAIKMFKNFLKNL